MIEYDCKLRASPDGSELSGKNSTGRVAELLLHLPVGFLVLTVLVRIVPFPVRPTLVLRRPHAHMTTLNLEAGEKTDPRP
jgi:hypothetical protein